MVIIRTNNEGIGTPMLHTKVRVNRFTGSRDEDF